MNIRTFRETDRAAWDDYVANHPSGTFFHLTGWKDVIEESFGHKPFYLLAQRDGGISGVLPLFSVKSFLFGRSMVSTPFAPYGGILADREETAQALYDEAVNLTRDKGLDYLEMRSETAGFGDLPTKDLYFVFRKEISPENDRNLEAIPRKTRRMVRLGMKNGLEASFGSADLLDPFYGMFAFNYRRLGTPVFSSAYLRNLLEQFGEKCSILVVSKDGKPLSGVLSFYYKDQVIPYYSGAYPEANDHAANDYLYWALMRDAADKGCRVFDFGRSKKDTGPYNFKRHWGFEPKALEYQYYLNRISKLPNLSPSNPKYRKRIEMWKKLPLWATKLIGPRIIKYVP
jgi:FemAB-related protein (PEP-CTERM system-associated)